MERRREWLKRRRTTELQRIAVFTPTCMPGTQYATYSVGTSIPLWVDSQALALLYSLVLPSSAEIARIELPPFPSSSPSVPASTGCPPDAHVVCLCYRGCERDVWTLPPLLLTCVSVRQPAPTPGRRSFESYHHGRHACMPAGRCMHGGNMHLKLQGTMCHRRFEYRTAVPVYR